MLKNIFISTKAQNNKDLEMKLIKNSLLFTLLLLCNINLPSYAGKKEIQNEILYIEYNNPINGYKVNIIWEPIGTVPQNSNLIIGPAILNFTNIKNNAKFAIVNNFFSLHKKNTPFIKFNCSQNNYKNKSCNSLKSMELSEQHVKLEYNYKPFKINQDSYLVEDKPPFFFQDVNFDEKDELIIVQPRQGQRGVDNYKIFSPPEDNYLDDFTQPTNYEPFRNFDDLTDIDYEKKEIWIHRSGGACSSSFEGYRYESHGINLFKIVDYDYDENNCKMYEFNVIDGEKKLVKVSIEK